MSIPDTSSLHTTFQQEHHDVLAAIDHCKNLECARKTLYAHVTTLQYRGQGLRNHASFFVQTVIRDCARVLRSILSENSDLRVGFSVTQALWDIAQDRPRPDLTAGFYMELHHLLLGVAGHPAVSLPPNDQTQIPELTGRDAARIRSEELDAIWAEANRQMNRFESGLTPQAIGRFHARRQEILDKLHGSDKDWNNWHWQVKNIITTAAQLQNLIAVSDTEIHAVEKALRHRQPFGITPYYAALMDNDPTAGRDLAVRAQVIPPLSYVDRMAAHGKNKATATDFMLELDTSPLDLVTRRYPGIVILKPFHSCPQICVYCQRNWEIERPMAPGAMAPKSVLDRALDWIASHPAITEVLVTGGDPLAMSDRAMRRIIEALSTIDHVEMIRIGTRTPVTLPMRITPELARLFGAVRQPGKRELCVVTHIEHVSEVTPDVVRAVDLLKREGIHVYNQMVFTSVISRRFEATALRRLLRLCGIDPYYTFAPKGKDETEDYRVPIARILQEQKEEARLLPGTRRTDEPVFNVPGLGKNHLRAFQHRDLVSILPDGSRVYEYHPWEKNLVERESYISRDVPIASYLQRLAAMGENPEEYATIWYYF